MLGGVRAALACLLLFATAVSLQPPSEAGSGAIRPGDSLNGICTLNFVYDGAGGAVYIGTAAHCVSNGQTVSTTQYANFGTVVLDDPVLDFALIRVRSDLVGVVDPSVKGWPDTPTGYTLATETSTGDITLHTGYGIGFGATALTRETRVGVLVGDSATHYSLDGPNVNGDSGAPIVHMETGKALGIISQYGLGTLPPTTDYGPTIQGVLARSAQLGLPVTVRTV